MDSRAIRKRSVELVVQIPGLGIASCDGVRRRASLGGRCLAPGCMYLCARLEGAHLGLNLPANVGDREGPDDPRRKQATSRSEGTIAVEVLLDGCRLWRSQLTLCIEYAPSSGQPEASSSNLPLCPLCRIRGRGSGMAFVMPLSLSLALQSHAIPMPAGLSVEVAGGGQEREVCHQQYG